MENPMNKWMIWGYHYFWKHLYHWCSWLGSFHTFGWTVKAFLDDGITPFFHRPSVAEQLSPLVKSMGILRGKIGEIGFQPPEGIKWTIKPMSFAMFPWQNPRSTIESILFRQICRCFSRVHRSKLEIATCLLGVPWGFLDLGPPHSKATRSQHNSRNSHGFLGVIFFDWGPHVLQIWYTIFLLNTLAVDPCKKRGVFFSVPWYCRTCAGRHPTWEGDSSRIGPDHGSSVHGTHTSTCFPQMIRLMFSWNLESTSWYGKSSVFFLQIRLHIRRY